MCQFRVMIRCTQIRIVSGDFNLELFKGGLRHLSLERLEKQYKFCTKNCRIEAELFLNHCTEQKYHCLFIPMLIRSEMSKSEGNSWETSVIRRDSLRRYGGFERNTYRHWREICLVRGYIAVLFSREGSIRSFSGCLRMAEEATSKQDRVL